MPDLPSPPYLQLPIFFFFFSSSIGTGYFNLKDNANAIIYFKHAIEIELKHFDPESRDVAKLLFNLAVVYRDHEDFANAIKCYKHSLAIEIKNVGADHPDVVRILNSSEN